MALTRKQTALIHVARRECGLSDTDYRLLLRGAAGVESSKDLSGEDFEWVMDRFKALGFKHRPAAPVYGERFGYASPAQVSKIRALWAQYTDGTGDDASLGRWLGRVAKVSHLRFVTSEAAPKVITALLNMVERKR